VLSSEVKRSPKNLSRKKQSLRLRLRKKKRRLPRLPPKPRRKKLQSLRRNPYQLKT